MAISSKSPPSRFEVFLERARVCIGDFKILQAGPYKTIQLEKTDNLQLDSDLLEEDQALSASKNTDNYANSRNSKKILMPSNSKAIIKPLLAKKPFL